MSTRNPILSMTLVAGALILVSAFGAYGQLQSGGQQTCLNSLNKDGAAVAKEQGKENVSCVKNGGKTTAVGTQACLTADAKGKVGKKKLKTTADDAKSCGSAPSFGYTGGTTVNGAAQQAEIDLTADVFGANLDTAVASCTGPTKPLCLCQQKISKTLESLASVKVAEFVRCKKAALKAGATSAAALRDCVNNVGTAGSIAADTKGKIAKTVIGLNAAIVKTCDPTGASLVSFPGTCNGLSGAPLGTCLDTQVECRVCQMINEMDGLFVNCDAFDDGIVNASCASGTGPTPTPSPTITPTPGPTATFQPGTIVKGALTATAGRFNYNLTVGLPGANAACSSSFAGTHACTYAELQSAAALGELIALTDTTSTAVTAFWAIDSSAPALEQCQDDTPGTGTLLNWEYPTAHTVSRGRKVALTNPTGVLGPLQPITQCNFSNAWVGCCL